MLGLYTSYRKNQHKIVHPRFEEWMKRQAPKSIRDRLFVYLHLRTFNFIIALWASPTKNLFQDIVNIGPCLANFNHGMAQNFILNVRDSVSGAEFAKQLREGYSEDESTRVQRLMEEREQYHHRRSNKLSLLVRNNNE